MKVFIFAIIVGAFFTFNSCKTISANESIQKANITEIVKTSDVVLVDVRVADQFAEGTAINAINIPLAEIENTAESLKGKKVVVFCNKGIQADEAVEILKKKGVEVYDGSTLKNVQAIQNLK